MKMGKSTTIRIEIKTKMINEGSKHLPKGKTMTYTIMRSLTVLTVWPGSR